MVYILLLIYVILCAWNWGNLSKNFQKFIYYQLIIFIILIVGLRFRVGLDTITYTDLFKRVTTNDLIFGGTFEPGYNLVCVLCKKWFGNNFYPVQLIMGSITNVCILLFIKKNCKNPFIGVFFYLFLDFFYFSFEIMRESAAIGISLINYNNIQKKKLYKYYLIALLAISFHYSAAITLLFPLVKYLKLNSWYIIVCIGMIFITPLLEQVNHLLSIVAVSTKIEHYIMKADVLNFNWRIGQLIKNALPAIICLLYLNRYKCSSKYTNLLLLQILFCSGAFAVPIVFARFTNYTMLFICVVSANLLVERKIKHIYKVLFVCFILMTQAQNLYTKIDMWHPYVSVMNPHQVPKRELRWYNEFHK